MKTQEFSIKARLKSFQYAFEGMEQLFRRDQNVIIHFIATIMVIVLAIITKVNPSEIIALVFAIGFVWVAELFNSAVEKIMDIISLQYHPRIKFIKDVSAAAVLVAAITSMVIGCIIFIPKIILWFV